MHILERILDHETTSSISKLIKNKSWIRKHIFVSILSVIRVLYNAKYLSFFQTILINCQWSYLKQQKHKNDKNIDRTFYGP